MYLVYFEDGSMWVQDEIDENEKHAVYDGIMDIVRYNLESGKYEYLAVSLSDYPVCQWIEVKKGAPS